MTRHHVGSVLWRHDAGEPGGRASAFCATGRLGRIPLHAKPKGRGARAGQTCVDLFANKNYAACDTAQGNVSVGKLQNVVTFMRSSPQRSEVFEKVAHETKRKIPPSRLNPLRNLKYLTNNDTR
ncbi:hypothetical protein JDV02_003141 [Purpureocillium takamizusanense]|uniref:Uncharacterized protein n=1 Tax=Purpureocillium takamizusanense TaxID=2060973 RepID=A0A9Q8V858_9HYPO|nr:uncharacterized protein JDV02_003141 [Purpureocillium takamizusanense]UNI16730.1 hypothetical protein JDV02_003141 [Purpureocillium takamizusanense]